MPVGVAAILCAFQGGGREGSRRADCFLRSFLKTRSFRIGQSLVRLTHLAARGLGVRQFTQQDTFPGRGALSKLPQIVYGKF